MSLKPPIRIVQVLEATTGGTRRHLAHLLDYLDRRRFSLALIYARDRDPHFLEDLQRYAANGVELHEVPMKREIHSHDLISFMRIFRLLKRGHYQIVHTHSSKAGFLGRVAARFVGGMAIVHTPHSFAFEYCPLSLRGWFYRVLERLAGILQHRLVCVSQGERKVALRYRLAKPKAITVIPNTIAPRTAISTIVFGVDPESMEDPQ